MTISFKYASALLLATTALGASLPALADPRDDRINALEQKLESALDEIRALKQEQAAEKAGKDTVAAQAAQAIDPSAQKTGSVPGDIKVSLTNGRPTLSTSDGRSTISIRALVEFDTAAFAQTKRAATASDLSSGTNFRRARFGVEGKIAGDWSYSFLYDMGASGAETARLSDAYLQYDGLAPFHFRTGAFITPGGLEDQTSVADLIFLERAAPTDLARSLAGADGRKNILSVFAYGDDYHAAVTWSGARAADPTVFDAQQAAVGRVAYRIYKDADTNVLLSATGSYVFKVADTAAGPNSPSAITFQEGVENGVDATRLVSTGAINARKATVWGVESGANWKNLYAQAGYFGYGIRRRASTLPDPGFNGWYAQGTWVLTGESRSYNATTAAFGSPRAAKPFDLKKGDIGAWELTARYSVVDLDYNEGIAGSNTIAALGGIRGGRQDGYTVGLNWYPNPIVRLILDYQHLDVLRLATTAPFGQIGQKVDIAAARAQFAF